MSVDKLVEELGYRRRDLESCAQLAGGLLLLGYDSMLLRAVGLALNEPVELPPTAPLTPLQRETYERALARAGHRIGT